MNDATLPRKQTAAGPPQLRLPPNIGTMLHHTAGVGDSKALWVIRRQVLPLRTRVIDTIRFLISGHAFTAEWDLIRALADCRSSAEIEAAFFEYQVNPTRSASRIVGLIIGTPCRQSALRFYRSLQSDWRSRTAA